MTEPMSVDKPLPEPGTTAIVVGGGMAGLVAARELAHAGVSVTVIEASAHIGGAVAPHEVGGLVLDAGAESYATRTPVFARLAEALGLGEQLVEPSAAGAWLHFLDGRGQPKSTPLPKGALLGIPGSLDEPVLREILGRTGLLRAKLDVNLPRGVGAKARSLADLVRARMGQAVLDRLVAPVVGGVYSVSPEDLDPEEAIPGLRAAIAEHGSLSAAIAALRGKATKPGSAVGGLRGGVFQIARALRTELEELGVTLLLDTSVQTLKRTGTAWHVGTPAAQLEAQRVVVATEAHGAVELLAPLLDEASAFGEAFGAEISLVTLVVDLPELDAAPRGTGVLVAPQVSAAHPTAEGQVVRAKALTHATAKWPWLADEEGPGTHVLRLSYALPLVGGAETADGGQPSLELALADASALLGLTIRAEDVVDSDVLTWRSALSAAGLGQKAKIAALRAAVEQIDGLAVTGAWLAGNGMAAVIADAQAQAQRIL
ncbi:protoporphyrinogen oxidase [Psychromicrobium xiongbiense]|uniref:protoporphyrinogen oxidase n=1 Tax=Psychromicrobium xiongbiense TaxID=3051184 RepID=UPI002557B279|nr:protoporphyrinogen oxidase [Psychromicrobium sp. YIM S02556]